MIRQYAVLVGLEGAEPEDYLCWRQTDTNQLHHRRSNASRTSESPAGSLSTPADGWWCISVWAPWFAPCWLSRSGSVPDQTHHGGGVSQNRSPGGANEDPTDAALAFELPERHRYRLAVWRSDHEPLRRLRHPYEERRKALDTRTALCNCLSAWLKE